MVSNKWNLLALAGALVLGACSEDLAPGTPDAGIVDGDGGPITPSKVKTTDNGDGTFTTIVDAVSMTEVTGFDFQTRTEHAPSDKVWDLWFRRFEVRSNGGVNGEGGVEVAVLPLADFATLKRAPGGGWVSDTIDDTAFNAGDGWYVYDPSVHLLKPRDIVYVVRSAEGAYFKLQFTSYYDDAGGSGHPTFRWAPVEAPPADDMLVVDASQAGTWTYVSALNGVISVANPQTSTTWDLAFSRTQIASNGGASGKGLGAARRAPDGDAYAAISGATTIGYAADRALPAPGGGTVPANPVLSDWFTGDPATPRPVVMLVRTAQGAYAKLQIVAWADGKYTIRLADVVRQVQVESASVDSSQRVYFSLRQGQPVADPAGDWDISFDHTLIATNSGTSGPGKGGAFDPGIADLSSIVTAVGVPYQPDQLLTGGSQSGVLADWYDAGAHLPRTKAYLVRTADGGHVKLQLTSYTGSSIGFDWAYAGAGRDDFPITVGP
jgi:hypothetical protein